jgi:hypothetical protein
MLLNSNTALIRQHEPFTGAGISSAMEDKRMKQSDDKRRSFLKQLFAGTAVVAGTAIVGKKATAQETETVKQQDEVLYKKTDAFKKYYDSLR